MEEKQNKGCPHLPSPLVEDGKGPILSYPGRGVDEGVNLLLTFN
jgi:hypothetical protein